MFTWHVSGQSNQKVTARHEKNTYTWQKICRPRGDSQRDWCSKEFHWQLVFRNPRPFNSFTFFCFILLYLMSTILSIYKQDQVQILEVMGSNPEFDMKGNISSKPWASVFVLAGWEWCRFGDREMMVLMTCSACFFVCLVVFVSTQEHLPKRGATDSRVSPPASIINEGKSPQTCPYADPVEAIARLRWPSFQVTLCRAGKKKKKNRPAQLFFLVDTVLFTPGTTVVFLTLVDYMPGS